MTAPSATPPPADLDGLATPLALGRAVIGAAMLLSPARAARPWIGDVAATPGGRTMTRAFAVRDLAIGVGTAVALTRGNRDATRAWLLAGVASDAVDAAATLRSWKHLPRAGRRITLAVATSAAVVGSLLAAD